MPLLVLFVVLVVAASLMFWWSNTRTRYRIKYRDKAPGDHQGRKLSDRGGPDWQNMLD
ncbi:MAG: hypothetical protein GY713_21135 [Actinomycetia bacterium]|nr:hypothetical protein [Actinomycetes bacterium]MCP4228062.1 hypothetical protein [Actinomycetes bacterium]